MPRFVDDVMREIEAMRAAGEAPGDWDLLAAEIRYLRAVVAAKDAEIARLREALETARDDTQRHPLEVGFNHSDPTRKELQYRLDLVKTGVERALSVAVTKQESE